MFDIHIIVNKWLQSLGFLLLRLYTLLNPEAFYSSLSALQLKGVRAVVRNAGMACFVLVMFK